MTDKFSELPPPARRTGVSPENGKFDEAARLAQTSPNRALHVATEVSRKTYQALRIFRGEPFRSDEGEMQINMRNSSVYADGIRRGDLYFTWVPTNNTESE